ncbi:polysaccharide export protein [Sphingomonas sp. AP4-R1]|uniref:polysaccharide biosynthesis/export family protein n=1 Tax=Sphingomonas sp. AP4-R1 TaxID=2735134 RepID=UPI0014934277|nr:polysaccharide biosynthesis/export family protein [Sphingomonas sp. AP4-R1]QJU57267.1 polysaccharide export protein [Sphingomonas sp. AP4-R1]
MVRKTIACVGLLAMMLGSGANVALAQSAPASAPAGAGSGGYTLGPGDKLQITVYGEEDLSSEQQVGPDGTVAIPLIGRVPATGRTTTALTDEIRSKLAEGFVQNPSVTVTITTYRPFYILGEVNTPGQYEYANGMTVMSAVARAGGFTYRAKKGEVFVKHAGGQEERVKLTGDLPIQPGDTIRVGERYF